jgi:hypothetical protein
MIYANKCLKKKKKKSWFFEKINKIDKILARGRTEKTQVTISQNERRISLQIPWTFTG